MMPNANRAFPITLSLEIPIHTRLTKSRGLKGIDPDLCLLTFGFATDVNNVFGPFGSLINSFCPEGKRVYITPYSEFRTIKEVDSRMQNEKVEVFSDLNMLASNDPTTLSDILCAWNAESLIIFFGNDDNAREIIKSRKHFEPTFWSFSNDSFEMQYLNQLNLAEPFIFYAETHQSIEIFGYKSTILNCADRIRQQMMG